MTFLSIKVIIIRRQKQNISLFWPKISNAHTTTRIQHKSVCTRIAFGVSDTAAATDEHIIAFFTINFASTFTSTNDHISALSALCRGTVLCIEEPGGRLFVNNLLNLTLLLYVNEIKVEIIKMRNLMLV